MKTLKNYKFQMFLVFTLLVVAGGLVKLAVLISQAEGIYDKNGLRYVCSRNGVEYVEYYRGLSVSVDRDGKPILCDYGK